MTTWLHKRRERRRRRQRFESLVAWVVVPLFVLGLGWLVAEVREGIKATPLDSILTGRDARSP